MMSTTRLCWRLGFVFFSLAMVPHWPAAELRLRALADKAAAFEPVEFEIGWDTRYANPFNPDEVQLELLISPPSGPEIRVPAYWHQPFERKQLPGGQRRDWIYLNGPAAWRARFSAATPGEYKAKAWLKDKTGTHTSAPLAFTCVTSTNRGFLRVSRKDPRFLEFTDGTPFFGIGQNLAFIGSQQYVQLWKAEEIFRKLQDNGANYLRVWACCEDWAMAIEARKSAWGRSWNWKPPFASVSEGGQTRNVVKLTPGSTLKPDPSHPVALRPGTEYEISGRLRAPAGSKVALQVRPGSLTRAFEIHETRESQPFSATFRTGENDYWLTEVSLRLESGSDAQLSDLSLREAAGGPELLWEAEPNRPRRGTYNPLDSFLLDELLKAAARHGQYLELTLLTRDLYMEALKSPDSPEYDQAIADAKKFFRYAVARWGAFTSVAAWEYWNEMNPGLPTDRFYADLGKYLEQIDPYDHLRATSTWGPSAKDCRHPELDIADTHFYLRPADKGRLEDEVHAVIERTAWLRQQAPNKPAQLGEFGLADDQWRITDQLRRSPELADMHNALWASALSGASSTGLFWWWERLDQRNAYPLYRPVSRFVADIPWTGGTVRTAAIANHDERVRVLGLQAGSEAWLWCFNKEASWSKLTARNAEPEPISDLVLELQGAGNQPRTLEWWNTAKGSILRTENATPSNGVLRLTSPPFTRDIAVRVRPAT